MHTQCSNVTYWQVFFEQGGSSQVLIRFPGYGKMTRERLQNAIDNNLDGEQGRSYLKDCWFPRELFRRWREMHHLPKSAPRFEPQDNYVVTATHLPPSNKGGRPPKVDWDALKDALREEIKTFGSPDPQRPPGWRGTKDVVDWAFQKLGRTGEGVAVRTVEDHVRKMLRELAAPAAKPVSR